MLLLLIMQVWDGYRLKYFLTELKKAYKFVKIVKPEASRKESSEIYILAQDFFMER